MSRPVHPTLSFNETTFRSRMTAKPYELCTGFPSSRISTLDTSVPYFVNAALNAPLAIATTFANLLTLLAMSHATSIRLPSKLLLCSLVLTDLGTGLVVQPQFATFLFVKAIYPGLAQCALFKSFAFTSSFFSTATFCMLTAISLDRYAALFSHLKYQQIVTTRRVCVVLAFVCSFSLFIASTNGQLWEALTLTVTVVNFNVISVVCIKIYRRLRVHQVEPQALEEAQVAAGNTLNMERYRRIASAMKWVYVLFLICYVPLVCVLFVTTAIGRTALTVCLEEFGYTLVLLSSFLNPFVYCLRMPDIRTEVVKQLRKLWCESSQQ